LSVVQAIPGAIGYAELWASESYNNIDRIQIDGHDPDIQPSILQGVIPQYQFWTTEHMLTMGTPPAGSLLAAFLTYLNTDKADNVMGKNGDSACDDLPASRQQLVCQR
jgi:hypothetical protein